MKARDWAVWAVAGSIAAAGCGGQATEAVGTGGGTGSGAGPTTTSSSSSSGTMSSSSGTTTGTPVSCLSREPKNHRPAATPCPLAPSTTACKVDTDCTIPNPYQLGKCVAVNGGSFCDYGCTTDDDCLNEGIWVCSCEAESFGYAPSSTENTCVDSNCQTDSDCGAGSYCSPTVRTECGGYYGVGGFYCHTCQDTCVDDSDCPGPGGYCAYSSPEGHWACTYAACAG